MTPPARRSSLGMLLRRSKSGELKGKKAQDREKELQRQRDAAIPKSPPRLPVLYNGAPAPDLETFGGEVRPDSVAIFSGHHGHDGNGTSHSAHADSQSLLSRPSIDPGRPSMSIPVPPIPNNWADPYARTESMTHRGRYSYASSAISTVNSPRRVRRRKDPTPFNILIVGAQGSGKTSFLEFLKTALALPPKKRSRSTAPNDNDNLIPKAPPSGTFIPHYLETEIDGERVGLTLWDSEGLEKNVVDLQLREMLTFLESKFEDTFTEEMKVMRSPGAQDTHIHAVFLILDPARLDRNIASAKAQAPSGHNGKYAVQPRIVGGLDEDLDLQVLRTLQGKTTVIPVISKADTITTKHMDILKRTVWGSLKKASLDPLLALGFDDGDDGSNTPDSSRIVEETEEDDVAEAAVSPDDGYESEHRTPNEDGNDEDELPIQGCEQAGSPSSKLSKRDSIRRSRTQEELKEDEPPFIPMSIISPDIYEPGVVGRAFPWGFADPYNESHCDFVRLKEAVFSDWRAELREASREQWYETWRTSRLKQRENGKGGAVRRYATTGGVGTGGL